MHAINSIFFFFKVKAFYNNIKNIVKAPPLWFVLSVADNHTRSEQQDQNTAGANKKSQQQDCDVQQNYFTSLSSEQC